MTNDLPSYQGAKYCTTGVSNSQCFLQGTVRDACLEKFRKAKRRDTLLAAVFLLPGAIAKGSANAAPYMGATLTFWQAIAVLR